MTSGKIARQTFDLERAKILLEQSAESLDAARRCRSARAGHRPRSFRPSRRRENRRAKYRRRAAHAALPARARGGRSSFAVDLELDENVFAGSVTEHQRDVALGDLERFSLVLAAVDDRRHRALRFDFADRRSPRAGAPRCREFYLFSHGFSLLVRAVVDLEERRNGFVIMNPFDAFAEQLRDAKHRGRKTFHGANGHAVGRY